MFIGIQGAQVRSRGIEYSTEIRLSQMRYDNDILGLVALQVRGWPRGVKIS